MPGKDLPFRIDLGADGLGKAEDHAARQCSPQAAEAADDHRLECEDQPGRTDQRIKGGAGAEIEPGDRDNGHGEAHGEGKDARIVDAHQLGDDRVVGGGAKGSPGFRLIEKPVERGDDDDGGDEGQQRHRADRQTVAQANRNLFKTTCLQPLRISGKDFQHAVLQHDGQPERHQQRWQDIPVERSVEQHGLQQIADAEHDNGRKHRRDDDVEAKRIDSHQDGKRAKHHEIAMGEIDQPHDAEDDRQTDGEQRVKSAEKNALYDCVDPDHLEPLNSRNRRRESVRG